MILDIMFVFSVIMRGVIRPMYRLNKKMTEFTRGDYDVRANVKTRDEFGRLARSFDEMADTLQEHHDELSLQNKKLAESQVELEDQSEAVLNVLEDVEEEKIKLMSWLPNWKNLNWLLIILLIR